MAKLGDVIDYGLLSARPAAGIEGRLFQATDTGILYRDNGATWDSLFDINSLTAEDDPASGADYVAIYSAAAGALRKVLLANLPSAGGAVDTTGEIMLTAAGGWPSTTGGCAANAKVEYGTNDVDLYTLDFDPDSDEYAQWTVWMPDDWDGGTVTAKFAWTAASGSGDAVWGIQGRAYADDDAIDAAWGTAQTVADTLTAAGDVCLSGATPACTLAGSPAAGQLVQFRVYRDADAGGDTLAADARLLAVKLTYGKS